MTTLPAFPTQTGDNNKDIRNLLRWCQVVSRDPRFLADQAQPDARLAARHVTGPTVFQASDEILYVTAVADHDQITLPTPSSAASASATRRCTIMIVGGSGGLNIVSPSGKINFNTAPYYLGGNPGGRISLVSDGTDWFIYSA